jgi:hypothetical protein
VSNPKVTEFVYTSEDGGIFQLTVRRRPEDHFASPLTNKSAAPNSRDVPDDIREAIRVWLAGNQS